MPVFLIEDFIEQKKSWIEKHQNQIQRKKWKVQSYSEEEVLSMKEKLQKYLENRVKNLWKETDLPPYTSLKVTKSERRWGSCSGKNRLCFSYRLAEYSEKNTRYIDAIIYHELAHLKEKNHGKKFWHLVYSMMPDYEEVMSE
jgi:predicted metal-dependent hydrolase